MDKMKTAIIIPTVPGNSEVLQNFIFSIKLFLDKKDYIIHVEKNDWIGFGTACNKGIKEVFKRKDIDGVITTNDDIEITEKGRNCIGDMRRIAKENNGIVSPLSLYRDTHIAMGFCYFPRKILEDVGLFDERFKILEWEDTDLSVRIQDAGYTLNKLPYNVGTHGGGVAHKRFNEEQKNEVSKNRQRFLDKWKYTKWEKIFK